MGRKGDGWATDTRLPLGAASAAGCRLLTPLPGRAQASCFSKDFSPHAWRQATGLAAGPELMGLGPGSEGLELRGVLPPSGQPPQLCLPPATTTDREQLLRLSHSRCAVARAG